MLIIEFEIMCIVYCDVCLRYREKDILCKVMCV